MGFLCTVNVKDVNGINSRTRFWTNDTLSALGAAQAIANLSNAAVVSCFLTEEIDLSFIDFNTASEANIETVDTKLKLRLSGDDPLSAGATRLTATISIPAPHGDFVDAAGGHTDDSLLTPFIGVITTFNGLVTNQLDKVYYSKSR